MTQTTERKPYRYAQTTAQRLAAVEPLSPIAAASAQWLADCQGPPEILALAQWHSDQAHGLDPEAPQTAWQHRQARDQAVAMAKAVSRRQAAAWLTQAEADHAEQPSAESADLLAQALDHAEQIQIMLGRPTRSELADLARAWRAQAQIALPSGRADIAMAWSDAASADGMAAENRARGQTYSAETYAQRAQDHRDQARQLAAVWADADSASSDELAAAAAILDRLTDHD